MLQNKNLYAKDLAELISRNIKKPKQSKMNRKHLSGTVDLKQTRLPSHSSEDSLKGRWIIQEIDYGDPKKASK